MLVNKCSKKYVSGNTAPIISLSRSITDILINLGVPPLNRHWWQVDLSGAEIAEYQPDLIICEAASLQVAENASKMMRQTGQKVPEIFVCRVDRLGSGIATIRRLGHMLGREDRAREIIQRENGYLKTARAKAKIGFSDLSEKPICMIILDFRQDSSDAKKFRFLACAKACFQADIIQIAGGEPTTFSAEERKNQVNWIDTETVARLAPNFIFTTGAKLQARITEYLASSFADEVPAVVNRQIMSFPEEMLAHFSCSYGYICLWLASTMYPDSFADRQALLQADCVLARKEISLPESLGINAELVESRLYDLPAKTIILKADQQRQILSSLHGWRKGVCWIGNHECPHPAWPLLAKMGMKETNKRVLALHALPESGTCLLHTGADISQMALYTRQSGPFTLTVLATAGVLFNALRSGSDNGQFVEAGTINLIVMSNANLSQECLVQCLIQATEAKVAALQSLDIRSCQSGLLATGTGTDNCIVVSGTGSFASMAGGHTKLGELVAKASYVAVRKAICRQHKIGPARPLPQRLTERGIAFDPGLLRKLEKNKSELAVISACLALEDAARHGLLDQKEIFLGEILPEWLDKLAQSNGETCLKQIHDLFRTKTRRRIN